LEKQKTKRSAVTRTRASKSTSKSLQSAALKSRNATKDAARKRVSEQVKAVRKRTQERIKELRKQEQQSIKRVRENARKLQAIERTLGEEFTSLKQATEALKRETIAVTNIVKERAKLRAQEQLKAEKQARKVEVPGRVERIDKDKLPTDKQIKQLFSKPSFTFGELSKKQKRTIESFLLDKNASRDLDKMLQPGEYWSAEIPYRYRDKDGKVHVGYSRTFNFFDNIRALFRKLSEYKVQGKLTGEAVQKWLSRIKIVRFSNTKTYKGGKIQ
jgi:hypothetical protein